MKREGVKIKPLEIFNLLAHNPGLTATENPRVGGSIPPLGTISLDFQTVIRWVARGLTIAVSIGLAPKPPDSPEL